jgi:hypothetical protein
MDSPIEVQAEVAISKGNNIQIGKQSKNIKPRLSRVRINQTLMVNLN